MSKVYIIVSGYYSAYKIEAPCSTREIAEATLALWGRVEDLRGEEHGEYRIEEHELDPATKDLLRQYADGWRWWHVSMLRDGSSEIELGVRSDDVPDWHHGILRAGKWGDGDSLDGDVFARDQGHAAKIASERLRELVASGEWDRKVERAAESDEYLRKHDEDCKAMWEAEKGAKADSEELEVLRVRMATAKNALDEKQAALMTATRERAETERAHFAARNAYQEQRRKEQR